MNTDRMAEVHSDPEILGGMPVFVGTRVLVSTIYAELKAGTSAEEILENYPSLKPDVLYAFAMGWPQFASGGPR